MHAVRAQLTLTPWNFKALAEMIIMCHASEHSALLNSLAVDMGAVYAEYVTGHI